MDALEEDIDLIRLRLMKSSIIVVGDFNRKPEKIDKYFGFLNRVKYEGFSW